MWINNMHWRTSSFLQVQLLSYVSFSAFLEFPQNNVIPSSLNPSCATSSSCDTRENIILVLGFLLCQVTGSNNGILGALESLDEVMYMTAPRNTSLLCGNNENWLPSVYFFCCWMHWRGPCFFCCWMPWRGPYWCFLKSTCWSYLSIEAHFNIESTISYLFLAVLFLIISAFPGIVFLPFIMMKNSCLHVNSFYTERKAFTRVILYSVGFLSSPAWSEKRDLSIENVVG